jgi:hypothetical protein
MAIASSSEIFPLFCMTYPPARPTSPSTYAIANNGHRLSGLGNTHTALGEMPAANCSHKAPA